MLVRPYYEAYNALKIPKKRKFSKIFGECLKLFFIHKNLEESSGYRRMIMGAITDHIVNFDILGLKEAYELLKKEGITFYEATKGFI